VIFVNNKSQFCVNQCITLQYNEDDLQIDIEDLNYNAFNWGELICKIIRFIEKIAFLKEKISRKSMVDNIF
jgi:hypothetical protein